MFEHPFIQAVLFYFERGGFVIWPLSLGAALLWFALGSRFMLLRRGVRGDLRKVIRNMKGEDKEPKGLIDLAIVLGNDALEDAPDARRQDFIDEALGWLNGELTRYSTVIFIVTAAAPLAGLLGTVTGMIETFDSMKDMSLFSQSGGIAGGISQALFTTQMGLAVAIPGLLAGRALQRKEQLLRGEIEQVKAILLEGPLQREANA